MTFFRPIHLSIYAVVAAPLLLLPAQGIVFVEWEEALGGNGHLYGITDSASDWLIAESTAISLGGHLASITSAAEQAFVESSLLVGDFERSPVWIGLTDTANEGTFVWSTGEPVAYTNWTAGEPNDDMNVFVEDFAAMNYYYAQNVDPKGKWNDAPVEGVPNSGAATGPYRGVVEIVPEPAGAAVLLAGLGLCLGRKRRCQP